MISVGRLRRDRGISVARPTALGNPFPIRQDCPREASLEKYRAWLAAEIAAGSKPVLAQLERIAVRARAGDVTLLCWCAPKPCHAEIVAEAVRAIC